MRRAVGIHGIQQQQSSQKKFQKAAQDLQTLEIERLTQQLEKFKQNLEQFSRKHRKHINSDPVFRSQFQTMCQAIGVDPLASNKGFWSSILGVGDYYYELGVKILEECLRTREKNGGLYRLDLLHQNLLRQQQRSSKKDENEIIWITEGDIEISIKRLKILGSGLEIIQLGSVKFLQSVPRELSQDHSIVLSLFQEQNKDGTSNNCFLSKSAIRKKLLWDPQRIDGCLEALLVEGLIWIDRYVDEKGVETREDLGEAEEDFVRIDSEEASETNGVVHILYWSLQSLL